MKIKLYGNSFSAKNYDEGTIEVEIDLIDKEDILKIFIDNFSTTEILQMFDQDTIFEYVESGKESMRWS